MKYVYILLALLNKHWHIIVFTLFKICDIMYMLTELTYKINYLGGCSK